MLSMAKIASIEGLDPYATITMLFSFFGLRRSRRQQWRNELQEELAKVSQKNQELLECLKECKLLLVATDVPLNDEQRAQVARVGEQLTALFERGMEQQDMLNHCRRTVEKLGGD
jgi:hypothetical protein